MSIAEFEFGSKPDNYMIYRVYNAGTKKGSISRITKPLAQWDFKNVGFLVPKSIAGSIQHVTDHEFTVEVTLSGANVGR
jgi:hypothetical protein